jgi:hypothetical protein
VGMSRSPSRLNGSGAAKAASVRVVSRRKQIENGSVLSLRQAAGACNVSPPVVRRWLSLGLLPAPPWTVEQLRRVRDVTDPQRHRLGSSAAHGTMARWNSGCSCAACRQMQRPGHAVGARRKCGFPRRCVSGFWMRFTLANPSGERSVILA